MEFTDFNLEKEITETKEEKKKVSDLATFTNEEADNYNKDMIKKCQELDVKLSGNLKSALKLRKEGAVVLSLREADALYRGSSDIRRIAELMTDCSEFGFMVNESILGQKNSIWQLRRVYNKTLYDIKTCKSSSFRLRYLEKLNKIKDMIDKSNSMIYKNEITSGFRKIFLHPEYMEYEKYIEVEKTMKVEAR